MEVEILETNPQEGMTTLTLKVSEADILEAMKESKESLALERGISEEALDEFVSAADSLAYAKEYALSKAVNVAIEKLNERVAAPTQIYFEESKQEGDFYEFTCDIYPHPDVYLTSYDPIDIRGKRIPAPGVSIEAAKNNEEGVTYIEDETVLLLELPKRLRGDIPDAYVERLVKDFTSKFEQQLATRGMTVDQHCEKMGISQKDFASLMTMEVRKKLPVDLALDALFEGAGLELDDEDIENVLSEMHPDKTKELRSSFEKHGDMYIVINQAKRKKALQWVKETAIV